MNAGNGDREGLAAFLLRMRGIGMDDRAVISAFEATPRRTFVPGQWQAHAWSQRMVPIACGEAMEGVDVQARAISALEPAPGLRVLEVGTGSGYTAAVLGRLCGRVISIDRFRTLAEQARQRIDALGLGNVVVRHADGHAGLPAEGPFDRIVVWSSFEALPREFVDQLSTNGVMVAPIGPPDGEQVLSKLAKIGSRFERQDLCTVRFQPIVSGIAAAL